jgi:hypothetical protein
VPELGLSLTRQPPDDTDWMDSFDSHSLNDDEMGRLVSIAMKQLGCGLAQTQFNDVMLALFEHIAGLETIPPKLARQYLATLWSMYQQATKANPSRH